MKKQVKLNEAQLKKIVAESVKRTLKELHDTPLYDNVDNSDIAKFGNNYIELKVPDFCLPYLVNGDTEGYSEQEIEQMVELERKFNGKLLNGLHIGDICIPLDGRQPSFSRYNDVLNCGGSMIYTFLVPLKELE